MPNTPEEFLQQPYSRILIPDENGTYSAEILEFPGCFAVGNTPNEAMDNLEKAAEAWIEISLQQGQKIPEPLANKGFGGKIALRLPRSIHRKAVQMAERDGVSLNQYLVSAIATQVGIDDYQNRLLDQLGANTPTGAYGRNALEVLKRKAKNAANIQIGNAPVAELSHQTREESKPNQVKRSRVKVKQDS